MPQIIREWNRGNPCQQNPNAPLKSVTSRARHEQGSSAGSDSGIGCGRCALDCRNHFVPLSRSAFGQPLLGVLYGQGRCEQQQRVHTPGTLWSSHPAVFERAQQVIDKREIVRPRGPGDEGRTSQAGVLDEKLAVGPKRFDQTIRPPPWLFSGRQDEGSQKVVEDRGLQRSTTAEVHV